MFLPYLLIYFHKSEGVSLNLVGGVLAAATLLSVGVVGIFGHRVAGLPVPQSLIYLHLLRAIARSLFIFASVPAVFVIAAFLDAATMRLAQMKDQALIMHLATGVTRRSWFALSRSMLNAGLGAGAALGGGILYLFDDFRFLLVLNVCLLVFAAWSFARVARLSIPAPCRRSESGTTPPTVRLIAWRDAMFVRFTLAEAALWICSMMIELGLPYALAVHAHVPLWLVGALFVLSTVVVTSLQGPLTGAMRNVNLRRSMVFAAILHAAGLGLLAVLDGSTTVVILVATVAIVVFSIGEVISGFAGPASISVLSPREHEGRYLAAYHTMLGVGSAAAPLLVTMSLSFGNGTLWGAGVALALAATVLVVWRRAGGSHRLTETVGVLSDA